VTSETFNRYGPAGAVGVAIGIAAAVLGNTGIKPFSGALELGPFGAALLLGLPTIILLALTFAWTRLRRPHDRPVMDQASAKSRDRTPASVVSSHQEDPLGEARPSDLAGLPSKVCPRCAETVKSAARICRFCGHEFEPGSGLETTPAPSTANLGSGLETLPDSARPRGQGRVGSRAAAGVAATLGLVAIIGAVLYVSGAIRPKHTLDVSFPIPPASQGQNLEWLLALENPGGQGTACKAGGHYSGIHKGAIVVVRDEGNKVVASRVLTADGTLTFGGSARCVYSTTIEGIPDASFYTVEVGERSGPTLSKGNLDTLNWALELTLD
jgi:uncharacterized protein UPF0547